MENKRLVLLFYGKKFRFLSAPSVNAPCHAAHISTSCPSFVNAEHSEHSSSVSSERVSTTRRLSPRIRGEQCPLSAPLSRTAPRAVRPLPPAHPRTSTPPPPSTPQLAAAAPACRPGYKSTAFRAPSRRSRVRLAAQCMLTPSHLHPRSRSRPAHTPAPTHTLTPSNLHPPSRSRSPCA